MRKVLQILGRLLDFQIGQSNREGGWGVAQAINSKKRMDFHLPPIFYKLKKGKKKRSLLKILKYFRMEVMNYNSWRGRCSERQWMGS
jgi:hypothetical protein